MGNNARLEYELSQLEKIYGSGNRTENSFYEDMPEIQESHGSPNIPGRFSEYTYYYDGASGKMVRVRFGC